MNHMLVSYSLSFVVWIVAHDVCVCVRVCVVSTENCSAWKHSLHYRIFTLMKEKTRRTNFFFGVFPFFSGSRFFVFFSVEVPMNVATAPLKCFSSVLFSLFVYNKLLGSLCGRWYDEYKCIWVPCTSVSRSLCFYLYIRCASKCDCDSKCIYDMQVACSIFYWSIACVSLCLHRIYILMSLCASQHSSLPLLLLLPRLFLIDQLVIRKRHGLYAAPVHMCVRVN